MSGGAATRAGDYESAFASYLSDGNEEALHRAYQLGRDAIIEGVGLLEFVQTHLAAVRSLSRERARAGAEAPEEPAAQRFFLEALSSFEITHRSSHDSNAALRKTYRRLEAEASRIARILHDEAGRLVVEAQLEMKDLSLHASESVRERCRSARDKLDQLQERIQDLAHDLRPGPIEALGLGPSLRLLAEGIAARGGCEMTVVYEPAAELPPAVETAVYRIVQEALTNVVRHAHAHRATVHVVGGRDQVECAIRDDGIGFPERPRAPGPGRSGLGLVGMGERVDALGGSLRIASSATDGTELRFTIPLDGGDP